MKKYGYLLACSLFIIVIGLLLMIIDVNSLEVIDGLPSNFTSSTKIYEYDENTKIYLKYNSNKVKVISNENIEGIKIEITYFEDYDNLNIVETMTKEAMILEISDVRNYHFYRVLSDLIGNLGKRKLYNYSSLYDANITVYANSSYVKNVIVNG